MATVTTTAAFEYAASLYEACDSMDEQRFSAFLTEDCKFVYANSEPVVGRKEAAAYVAGFMSMIAGIKHTLQEVWQVDDVIISRMSVTYTRKDQTKVVVPAMTVWRMRDQLIAEYLIFVDVSLLFAD